MRAYAEEGLSIVEVLPEPPNKFYVFVNKGLYVVILMPVIALLFHKYLPDFVAIYLGILLVIYILFLLFLCTIR